MSQNPLTRTRPTRRPPRIAPAALGSGRRRRDDLDVFGPDGPTLERALRIAFGLERPGR